MSLRSRQLGALLVFAVAAQLAPAAARGAAVEGTLSLTLQDALVYNEGRGARPRLVKRDLSLDVTCIGGKWSPVGWGFVAAMPGQEHLARITNARERDGRIELHVQARINHNRNNPMTLGGTAKYVIELRREEGAWTGSFTGDCADENRPEVHVALEKAWGYGYTAGGNPASWPLIRNHMEAYLATAEVRGSVTAQLIDDPVAKLDPSVIKPGEHPRLLFRKHDLPKLRQRAAMPEGRRIITQIEGLLERAEKYGFAYFPPAAEHSMGNMWATGHALLYQLTGEKRHADRAAALCHANLYGSYYYGGGWIHPYTLMGIAFSYDMCCDAWDDTTRQIMFSYLEQNIRQLAMRHEPGDHLATSERYSFANDQEKFGLASIRDAHANKFRAAAAIAGLALLHDAPPAYSPPPLDSVPTIEPPADYEPWIGVPVLPFESDIMPRRWLINGPFLRGDIDKAMQQVGGLAGVRPEPGLSVDYEEEKLDFRIYLPAGADAAHGGTIYARDCSRYWASATGGGYNPGIRLFRKWRDRFERNFGINVCLYTVIDNDRERIVQALPNWRSRSIGNRMWINGQPVVDGQLVRLKKGLYPLMVDVRVIGGYSGQSPKLREYTPQLHARDTALRDRAIRAFSGGEPTSNELLRSLHVLLRSVRRYLPADVGADGWEVWDTQETLLPLMLALRNALGVDLAKGTCAERLLPMAVRMRGHGHERTWDYMVSQSAGLMLPEHRPIARWYLDTYGLGIARPLDGVIALFTHPFDVAPQAPDKSLSRAGAFEDYNVHAFRNGWSGSKDFLTLIEGGSERFTSPYVAGNLRLHGMGRPWINERRGDDYLNANNLTLRGVFPTKPAKLVHAEHLPDGSGTLSMQLDGFRYGQAGDGKKLKVEWTGGDSGISVLRAFGVDYSGRSGAPVLIAMADTISLAAYREKVWRFDLGDTRDLGRTAVETGTVLLKGPSFTFRPPPSQRLPEAADNASMQVTFIAPQKVEFVERGYGEGRRTLLEAKIDRHVSKMDKVTTTGPDVLPKVPDDGLLDELDSGNKETQRRRLPPITVYTIVTVQTGQPPAVTSTGKDDATEIRVGSRSIRFDGKRIVFGD